MGKIVYGTVRGLGVLALLAAGACTHVKGVVLEDRTRRPVQEAEFTVGRPDGLGVFARHKVDKEGKFNFYISPTDEDFLFVWDGKGDPLLDVRKIDRNEISDHMTIVLPLRGQTY